MSRTRLPAEDRRRQIVETATPLFARRGFAGTTTKEIAEAAGVSEALLYKHFPGKSALYDAILTSGKNDDPVLQHLIQLPPSTGSLVTMMHSLVTAFLFDHDCGPVDRETRLRLMVNSHLEDGEFARVVYEWVRSEILPTFTRCLQAAQAAGDLASQRFSPGNALSFAHHAAIMMGVARLTNIGDVPYAGSQADLAVEATRFILRGIGLHDAAIDRDYHPNQIEAHLAGLFGAK